MMTQKEMCDAFVDSITTLVMHGYDEKEVMDWPLDKYYLISDSVQRILKTQKVETRKLFVIDNAVSIASLFSKKDTLKSYLKELGE